MDYIAIYRQAYKFMDESVIEGNCGELCHHHCCRTHAEDGEMMGIYLMPYEYESIFKGSELEKRYHFEKHSSREYEISPKVKYLYFFNCTQGDQCLREFRPIQCRTYPVTPHFVNGELELVVENEQVHQCPLLRMQDGFRREFSTGIYRGWEILLQIPEVRYQITYDSEQRILDDNIRYRVELQLK